MEQGLTPEQALVLAVNRIGGQAAMARLLEVAQPTVWGWLNRSDTKELAAEYVLKVEAATNVSRHDLRPDIYPRGLQDGVPFNADPLEGPLAPSADDVVENSG
jgi:DNA-binding transcriptional regulator YdaS (Cro superfamily)